MIKPSQPLTLTAKNIIKCFKAKFIELQGKYFLFQNIQYFVGDDQVLECVTRLYYTILLLPNCPETITLEKLITCSNKPVVIEVLQCASRLPTNKDLTPLVDHIRSKLMEERDTNTLEALLDSSIRLFHIYDKVLASDPQNLFDYFTKILSDFSFKFTIVSKVVCLSGKVLSKEVRFFKQQIINFVLIHKTFQKAQGNST